MCVPCCFLEEDPAPVGPSSRCPQEEPARAHIPYGLLPHSPAGASRAGHHTDHLQPEADF